MDECSANLISMKTHTENNNTLETHKFEVKDYEIPLKAERSIVATQRRTRLLFIIAWIFIGFAVLFLIGAIVFFVKFSGQGGGQTPTTLSSSSSSTISPTPSSAASVISSSTVSPSWSSSSSSTPAVSKTTHSINISTISTISKPVYPSVTTATLTVDSSSKIPQTTVISSVKSTEIVTTATVTITTTPVSVCSGNMFRCSDGTCIENTYVCDGKPHCPRADDEHINCTCSETQFRCGSGQCIEARFRCDKVPHCYDLSDEMNCSNCLGFQCASGQCLWSNSVKCNDVVDCLDLSDELDCGWRNGYRKCNNGYWIPKSKFCDGVDNCFDNSDERIELCAGDCHMQEMLCDDGKTCIMPEWECDGHADCPDGTDENRCGTCSSEQFQCSNYSCIPASQVCDGIKQCSSGNDEVDCLQLTSNGMITDTSGTIMMKSGNRSLPVCSDDWSADVADDICHFFGHRSSSSVVFESLTTAAVQSTDSFMILQNKNTAIPDNQSVLSRFSEIPICPSRKVVRINCEPDMCGQQQIDILTPYIVGGTISPAGKWPWVASISMLGQEVCGGTVVGPRWILTAAHCIVTAMANYTLMPHYYEVTAGTNTRQRTVNDRAQRRHVTKILLHPQTKRILTGVTDWDMALLYLDAPLTFGNYLQPVCLPSQGENFPLSSQCYLAGWGYINKLEVTVNDLREGKMRLWSEADCAANTFAIEMYINTNSTLCTGYHSGLISACQGDSGSPLMCQDSRDRWTVVGIMSHGINGCSGESTGRANRYAKVSSAADWIRSVIDKS